MGFREIILPNILRNNFLYHGTLGAGGIITSTRGSTFLRKYMVYL